MHATSNEELLVSFRITWLTGFSSFVIAYMFGLVFYIICYKPLTNVIMSEMTIERVKRLMDKQLLGGISQNDNDLIYFDQLLASGPRTSMRSSDFDKSKFTRPSLSTVTSGTLSTGISSHKNGIQGEPSVIIEEAKEESSDDE